MVDPTQIRRTAPPTVFNVRNTFAKSVTIPAQLEQNIQKQLQDKAQLIGDKYATGSLARQEERRKWSAVEESVQRASREINTALDALGMLETLLSQMKEVIARIEKEDPEQENYDKKIKAHAQTFQAFTRSAESTVLGSATRTTLFRKNGGELRYRISPTGAEQIEFGRDFSVSFSLEKENVSWVANRSMYTLEKRVDGQDTREMISAKGSVRLDSWNEDGTVNFSTSIATAAIAHHTNFDIKRGAFKILDVWVYENFLTESGRQRAQDDIKDTTRYIDFERSRLEMMKLTADFHEKRATTAVKEIDRENTKRAEQQAEEIKELKDEAMLKAQLLLRNVMQSEQQARNYALAFKAQPYSKRGGFKRTGNIFGAVLKMQV